MEKNYEEFTKAMLADVMDTNGKELKGNKNEDGGTYNVHIELDTNSEK